MLLLLLVLAHHRRGSWCRRRRLEVFFCRRPLPPGEPAERRHESVSVCSRKPFLMGSLTL